MTVLGRVGRAVRAFVAVLRGRPVLVSCSFIAVKPAWPPGAVVEDCDHLDTWPGGLTRRRAYVIPPTRKEVREFRRRLALAEEALAPGNVVVVQGGG